MTRKDKIAMKKTTLKVSPTQKQILDLLSDGKPHRSLRPSWRVEISQLRKSLRPIGLEIVHVHGDGYQLCETIGPQPTLLDDLATTPSRYVYFFQLGKPLSGKIKIGVSGNPSKRLKEIQGMLGEPLVCLGVIPNCDLAEESELHKRFATDRIHGEWFLASSDLLVFIRNNAMPLEVSL